MSQKSNQQCTHASLVKIHPLVQKITHRNRILDISKCPQFGRNPSAGSEDNARKRKSRSRRDPHQKQLIPTPSGLRGQKLFEKHINTHLVAFLSKYKLIHTNQPEFRNYNELILSSNVRIKSRARSTALAAAVKIEEPSVIRIILEWLSDITKTTYLCVVF